METKNLSWICGLQKCLQFISERCQMPSSGRIQGPKEECKHDQRHIWRIKMSCGPWRKAEVKTGIRDVCILSQTLFLLVLGKAMNKVVEWSVLVPTHAPQFYFIN